MSRTVDSRVVSMEFDNRHFEKNVQTSLSTLDKLKKSLNFDKATNSFVKITESSKKVDFGQLTSSIEGLSKKLSGLGVFGVTALANISNAAIEAGKKIVSALAIDPIKMGFKEYETQINAVQTILANTSSKGTTLTQVNKALDELNEYADKTIYNFTEMTKNIGTFTAAGIDLDTSVSAIKGIANLAAVSGSTSQQASTAMYQLSQALSSGTVKLQDWNSVVNAGMGGQVFQDALKETARVHGIAVDDIIKKEGSFRESLKEGWITSEILTETLSKFTGDLNEKQLKTMGYTDEQIKSIIKMGQTANDAATKVKTFTQLFDTLKEAAQSGWTQSWEIIVGDFEEAKELLTEISDIFGGIIGKASDARNEVLLKGLGSGWKQLLDSGISDEEGLKESIKNVAKSHGVEIDKLIEQSGSFEKAVKKGWLTSDILSESISKLTDKTRGLNNEELEKIGYTRKQVDELERLDEAIKKGTLSMSDMAKIVGRQSGRENVIDALRNSLKEVLRISDKIGEAFREIFPPITGEKLYDLTVKLKNLSERFKMSDEGMSKLKSTFRGIFSLFSISGRLLSSVGKGFLRIVKAISPVGGGLLNVTSSLGEFLVKVDEFIEKNKIFEKAANFGVDYIIKGIESVKGLISLLSKAKDYLVENFALPGYEAFIDILERINIRFGSVPDKARGVKESLYSLFQGIGDSIKNSKVIVFFGTLTKSLGKMAGIAIGSIGKGLSSVFESLSEVDFNDAIDIFNTVLAGGLTFSFIKFINGLKTPLDSLSDLFKGGVSMFEDISGVLGQVKGSLESYQSSLKADVLMKIAKAIAILAGSIFVIALIDSKKLTASLGAITVLFADLMGAMALISKTGVAGVKSTATMITTMTAMSTSILILSGALKIISGISWEGVAKGTIAIGSLIFMMTTAAKTLSGGSKMMKGAANILIFSFAIKQLAKTTKELASLSIEELAKGLGAVGILLAEIGAFLNIAKFGKLSLTSAASVIVLAGAIKILSDSVSVFGQMRVDVLKQGLIAVGTVLSELSIFMIASGSAKHMLTTSVGLIAIAGSLKIFQQVISTLGELSVETLSKGLLAMASSLGILAIATKVMPKNLIFIGAGLIVIGQALKTITNSVIKMGDMSWSEIARGLIALGGSLAVLSVALYSMSGTIPGSAALLVAATALSVLTPSLSKLGEMSWGSIFKGLVTIAGALGTLALAGALLTPMIPSMLAVSATFALFGVGILGIGVGITAAATGLTLLTGALTIFVSSALGLIPTVVERLGGLLKTVANMVVELAPMMGEAIKAVIVTLIDVAKTLVPELVDGALVIISGLIKSLSEHAPSIVDSLMTFLIGILNSLSSRTPELVEAGIRLIGSIFEGLANAIKGTDFGSLKEAIIGVGLVAGLVAAMSAIAPLVPSAMIGVLGIGVIIAELSLVLAAIGLLNKIPGISDLISSGGNILASIGSALGKFIGGIIGGFGAGVSSNLPSIGKDLSDFMTNVRPFVEGASSIDPKVFDGVNALAKSILLLTAADILNGLTSWITGGSSLSGFAKDLVPFGQSMKDFSASIVGLDTELVSNAAIAGRTLAEMAATLPNTGGVVSWFTGENDIDIFGEKLVPFGRAMLSFSREISGMDSEAVINAALAGKAIAEMSTTLPNTGGVVSWFTGNNDIDTFGERLAPFGKAMKDFSEAVKGVDPNVIINSATAGKSLVELANTLPNSGGVVSWFTGDNDIDKFGEKLVPFGKYLKTYSDEISGINPDAIVASSTVGLALSELATNLPNTGGIVSWFTGDNDISTFGESLELFGNSFAKYSSSMSGVDAGVVTATTNAATSIVNLQNSLPKTGGWFSDKATLKSFGEDLNSFGGLFSSFYTKVSSITASSLNGAINELDHLIKVSKGLKDLDTAKMNGFGAGLKRVGESGINTLITAFKGSKTKVEECATVLMDGFRSSAQSSTDKIKTTFTTIITKVIDDMKMKKDEFSLVASTYLVRFIDGAKSKEAEAKIAFMNITASCKSVLNNEYSNFYNIGGYLTQGFANGITANTYLAEARARAMAAAAANAAKNELKIHSPSKVGYDIGGFFGMGFVNALSDYQDIAYDKSSNMAVRAREGLANSISKLPSLLEGDVNSQPVIRPVLDLTDVESESKRLDLMFTRSQAISIDAESSVTDDPKTTDTQKVGGSINYNFTQNNYSPKALSRIDIYRQTKNQFSALERMTTT